MKVQANHGKVTQNMHGASRNYRYVWDVSVRRRQTLVSSPREIAATLHLKPSTWGNQRGARSHQYFNPMHPRCHQPIVHHSVLGLKDFTFGNILQLPVHDL